MANFKNLVIGGILIILFIFLIVNFSMDIGNEYSKDTSELDKEGTFHFSEIEGNLTEAKEKSEKWQSQFAGQRNLVITGVIAVATMLNIGMSMLNFVFAPIRILNEIFINVLHIPPIVTYVLYFMVGITFVFGLWKVFKTGS